MSESKTGECKEDQFKKDRPSVLEVVQGFCLSSHLETEFEDFAMEHSDIFVQSLDIQEGTEHPLEFHSIYRAYLDKFERKIENFIEEEGYNIRDFYKQCQAVLDDDEVYGSQRFFIEALLATSEYENFYILMRTEMHKYRK